MEFLGILFSLGLVLSVLLGPWILVWRNSRRRTRERAEDQERWADLTNRVYRLELALQSSKVLKEPSLADTPSPAPAAETVVTSAPEPVAERVLPQEPETPRVEEPPQEPVWQAAPSPPPQVPVSPKEQAAPMFSHGTEPAAGARFRSAHELEEALGTNWLNKLGVGILVLGIAFFLAYQIKNLGPAGKVFVGYAVSAAILGGGVWLQRRERYKVLARAGIGGGWALLFFTAYAMYHVPAAHVLESQALDLILMLLVAGGMVWHTLRYNSQVVTGLAFLLAFLTVTISHSNVYSLTAGAVLAGGLVVIVGRKQWFELELLGILASYLNHYLWLRPIIEPMRGHRHPFPEFTASVAILALYWAIFRLSYIFRTPSDDRQERISTIAALLNTVLLLLVLKYQSVHPEWAFWALLVIGGIEIALAQLPAARRRRTAVIVLLTIGIVQLVAAFPFRYSGMRLSVFWMLEAEAVLLLGVWTREIIFRRLGMLSTLLVAGQMISVDAARIYGIRMDDADVSSKPSVAVLFAVAAIVFYFNSYWGRHRWSDLFTTTFDRTVMKRLSHVGAIMAFIGAWIMFPEAWTAVAWCALGLGLALAARRFSVPEFGYQANLLAVAGVIRALGMNLGTEEHFHGISLRLITVALVVGALYTTAKWGWSGKPELGLTVQGHFFFVHRLIEGSYTWAASFLVALLAWYELRPVGVTPAWAVFGLVLLELGITRRNLGLRLQGYVAFLASFLRIFFVNLNASGAPGSVSPRFYTTIPVVLAFYYAYWRLRDDESLRERAFRAAGFCCWLGLISMAGLVRFELPADWVAAGWAGMAVALLGIAWLGGQRVFLHHSILMVSGVVFRTTLHNFYERSYFPAPPWENRFISVGAVVALLLAGLPLAFRLRTRDRQVDDLRLIRWLRIATNRPEQVFFFAAVFLLTVLLALEMRHGMVTLSWGLEGVAIFLFAIWVGERNFRLAGLGLLLLCAAKILLVDVWRLQGNDRYLTLIVLGAALLLVSFLYTRYRERIRQYL